MEKQAVIAKTHELKPFIGSTVGYLRINQGWIQHKSDFECAAWWEDSRIQDGVYELILQENRFAPYELYLSAKLNAVVVDDFFPALWAGSAIGNQPYQPKNLGEKRIVHHRVEIVNAIENTGNISGANIDYCVHPLMITSFISAARYSMTSYHQLMNRYWDTYQTEGDGKFLTNTGMVSHCAENIAVLGRAIEAMARKLEYFQNATESMRQNYVTNTAWVAA